MELFWRNGLIRIHVLKDSDPFVHKQLFSLFLACHGSSAADQHSFCRNTTWLTKFPVQDFSSVNPSVGRKRRSRDVLQPGGRLAVAQQSFISHDLLVNGANCLTVLCHQHCLCSCTGIKKNSIYLSLQCWLFFSVELLESLVLPHLIMWTLSEYSLEQARIQFITIICSSLPLPIFFLCLHLVWLRFTSESA